MGFILERSLGSCWAAICAQSQELIWLCSRGLSPGEKGQALCVLIPPAPHGELHKAQAARNTCWAAWAAGKPELAPCRSLLAQLFKDGFSQSLVISREGKKYPWAEHPKSLGTCVGVLCPFGVQTPGTVPTSAPPAHQDSACHRASTWECCPGTGQLLLLSSGLPLAAETQPCRAAAVPMALGFCCLAAQSLQCREQSANSMEKRTSVLPQGSFHTRIAPLIQPGMRSRVVSTAGASPPGSCIRSERV